MVWLHARKYTAVIWIMICLFVSCAPRSNRWGFPQYEYTYQIPQETNDGWQVSTLHAEGVGSDRINELLNDILNKRFKNIHSVLLVRNGKLVLEEYFYGYDRYSKHELHSVSKSITSILVGIAIDQEMISSVDENVYEFFPEYGEMAELSPLSETRFEAEWKVFGKVSVDFYKDENQNVKHFTLNYGFLHLDFDKIK